jgi:PAS domain S-box-containing protein
VLAIEPRIMPTDSLLPFVPSVDRASDDARLVARLGASLSQLETIYRSVPVGLAVHGHDLRFVRVNERMAEINGAPVDAHAGRSVRELLPQLADAIESRLRHVLDTGEPLMHVEIVGETALHPGVERRWLATYHPIRLPDGLVAGVNVVVEDVTERRAVELERERLLAAEQRARARAERLHRLSMALGHALAPEAVVSVAIEECGRIVGSRHGVLSLLDDDGRTFTLVAGPGTDPHNAREWRRFPNAGTLPAAVAVRTRLPVWSRTRDEYAARGEGLRAVAQRGGFEAEATLPLLVSDRPIGALSFAFAEARDFDDDDAQYFRTIADLCAQAIERARLYAAADAAREEAERERAAAHEASEAKSRFIATMSHELRTPLNAIQGHVHLLLLGLHGPITDVQRASLDRVQKAERHLAHLIDEVLDLARLEAGKVALSTEVASLAEIVRDTLPLVEPQAAAAGLVLEWCEDADDVQACVDRERLGQVLLNLLSNAVKFTPPVQADGTPGHIGVRIVPPATSDAPGCLVVEDTGVGIDPDRLQAIFEPFVQLHDEGVPAARGTGLGLAISRELARAMGGDLHVSSAPGQGSSFTVTLPMPDLAGSCPDTPA